jgi:hypothetical protein
MVMFKKFIMSDSGNQRWYETFSDWQKRYGDLIYMRLMGRHFIIINGLEDARELLHRRGNIHSGRGQNAMMNLV